MKPETKYGLFIGAGMILWNLADFALGFHTRRFDLGEISDSCSFLVPLIALLLLLLKLRHEPAGLSVGRALKSGAYAALVGGVITYLFMVVYNRFINFGWMDAALDWKVAQWRALGQTESAIRDQIILHHRMTSPLGCFLTIVVGSAAIGAVFSLMLSLFLRRQPAAA